MTPADSPNLSRPAPSPRPVGWWLVGCAAMVFAMVMLGGATRLTHSGLSMVEWQPLTFLPPLSPEAWAAEFANYQRSPQFIHENAWMTVDDFKGIYWLEYVHRLWGRLIGIAFFVPLVWFAARRTIDRRLGLKLVGLFALGGLQGALGWFMVASGLESRPDVSQYRLAAHLLTGIGVYGLILWVALDLLRGAPTPRSGDRLFARLAAALPFAVLLVIGLGALVAGLHAGLIYNTFPLMDGQVIPEGLGTLKPWWLNMFENVMTVQFDHRIAAMALVACVAALWWRGRQAPLTAEARRLLLAVLAVACLQAALGITTLLMVVPLPLALAHQTGALVLFTVAVWLAHAARAPRDATVTAPVRAVAHPA